VIKSAIEKERSQQYKANRKQSTYIVKRVNTKRAKHIMGYQTVQLNNDEIWPPIKLNV